MDDDGPPQMNQPLDGSSLTLNSLPSSLSDNGDHNTSTKQANNDHSALNEEQEVYLKKLVIQKALEMEFEILGADPSLECISKRTSLIAFLYHHFIADFPLFRNNSQVQQKLDDLILQYPRFTTLSRKATKTEDTEQNDIFVNVFDMVITTPHELQRLHSKKEYYEHNQSNNNSNNDNNSDTTPTNNMTEEEKQMQFILSVRREILDLLQVIMMEVPPEVGMRSVFETLEKADSIQSLPLTYRKLFHAINKGIIPRIHQELKEQQQVDKLNNLYRLTPRRAIKTVLKLTNPIKMVTNMIGLFLARPFGAKNLMQRIFEVVTETHKTNNLLKQLRKDLIKEIDNHNNNNNNRAKKTKIKHGSDICDKIQAWVEGNYEPTAIIDLEKDKVLHSTDNDNKNNSSSNNNSNSNRVEDDEANKLEARKYIEKILRSECDPIIQPDIIVSLTDKQIQELTRLSALEMRRKDKEQFVNLLGDEVMISAIKEILPVIYQPLSMMYKYADLPGLFNALFQMLKGCINAANIPNITDEQRDSEYLKIVETFEEVLFTFLKNIIAHDKENNRALEEILNWSLQLFRGDNRVCIDLVELFQSLEPQQQKQVIIEIDEWLEYKKLERKMKEEHISKRSLVYKENELIPPSQIFIAKYICPPFLAQCLIKMKPSTSDHNNNNNNNNNSV